MKKVYIANDPLSAHTLESVLTSAGIEAVVQDEKLFEVRDEVPVIYPTVWVRDEDESRALKLVEEHERTRALPSEAPPWTCPTCGETIAGTFDICWKCDGGAADQRPNSPEVQTHDRSRAVVRVLRIMAACLATGIAYLVVTKMFSE